MALVEAGLTYEGAQAHAGPRRLVLSVEGLNAKAADMAEERKGPRVDAPKPAIDGFLKSTGLKLEDLKAQDDKKGKFYIAVDAQARPRRNRYHRRARARDHPQIPLAQIHALGRGHACAGSGPLQSILCTFDGEVVPFAIDGIKSGNTTRGHRFMGAGENRGAPLRGLCPEAPQGIRDRRC